MIWLFKLTLTPVLVLITTLIIRRWGATIGGLVAGIPIMTGPITLFIALEHGPQFAVATLTAVLIAVVGAAMFSSTYALLSQFWTWPGTITMALIAWIATAFGLSAFPFGIVEAALAAVAAVILAIFLIPRPRGPIVLARPRWWDLPFRMLVTGLLVGGVTLLAADLGPHLSGIIGTLPLVSAVLAVFTHHQSGSRAIKAVLRGQMVSMIGFIVFFVVVAFGLEQFGIALTFTAALVLTLITSSLMAIADRLVGRLLGSASSRRIRSGVDRRPRLTR